MSRKALRSVYLDLKQAELLKLLSAKTRVPQAAYIREGLDLVLRRHEKKKKQRAPVQTTKKKQASTLTLLKG